MSLAKGLMPPLPAVLSDLIACPASYAALLVLPRPPPARPVPSGSLSCNAVQGAQNRHRGMHHEVTVVVLGATSATAESATIGRSSGHLNLYRICLYV